MSATHWHLRTDEENIAWLAIDVANSNVNTLSAEVLQELEGILAKISELKPKALAIHSTKKSGFIAGADIAEFTKIKNTEQAHELISRGHSVMNAIAALPFPTIAVIKGFCLGGGFELSLACDYRLAVNEPATRIGLPEVKLGIHPGFGGTARSIKAAGTLNAMNIMLTGRSLGAYQAKKMGLVDDSIASRQIENAVSYFAKKKPGNKKHSLKDRVVESPLIRPLMAKVFRREVSKKANPEHYPAPYALIDLWEQHAGDEASMLRAEIDSVANLITSDTSKNLVRVFQLSEELKGLGKVTSFKPDHVHVIGSGTMGGDIAAWCAMRGFSVTVEDSNPKALASTVKRAQKLFQKRFRGFPHLAIAARDRLITDMHGEGRMHADVIIEAIFEDEKVKQDLFSSLEKVAKEGAILATNTSSIPLETIASVLEQPERLVGLHFFNPVAKMPLVEVVISKMTDMKVQEKAQAFCLGIDKLPLPVKSSPGFLVNRILMPYLLEASHMVAEGIQKEAIDKMATDFGMPMGPLELSDTVGLDICKHVAMELSEPMGLEVPASIVSLIDKGKLGRKTGEGFYVWKKGKPAKNKINPEDISEAYQQRLIGKILDEAKKCLEDGIVSSENQVDAGVIFGTGFAPFRGGPLNYLKSNNNSAS